MVKKKVTVMKSPNKLEELALATVQQYKHCSSDEIMCNRDVTLAELCALEVSETRLVAQLKDIRRRQTINTAILTGMNLCVERRG